jgi:hypothetical protein
MTDAPDPVVAFAEQARAVRARHDEIIRRLTLAAAAAAQIRFDADLREAEGEIELAAYGRELAALITPTEPTTPEPTS